MIRKKVCLVGASAVGKTSLVERYVRGTFSDIYRTTIGVRIDRKLLNLGGRELDLLLWDLEGEDVFAQVRESYLRGASGLIIVADGIRAATLDTALRLRAQALQADAGVPTLVAINKLDLFDQWELSERDVARLLERNIRVERVSAKSGAGVAGVFEWIAWEMLRMSPESSRSLWP